MASCGKKGSGGRNTANENLTDLSLPSSSRGQPHYLPFLFSGQVKRADWKITYCTFSYVMQF